MAATAQGAVRHLMHRRASNSAELVADGGAVERAETDYYEAALPRLIGIPIAVEISAWILALCRSNRRLQGGYRAPVQHLPAMSEGDKCGHIFTDSEVARLDAPGTNDRAHTTQQVAGRAKLTWVALAQH